MTDDDQFILMRSDADVAADEKSGNAYFEAAYQLFPYRACFREAANLLLEHARTAEAVRPLAPPIVFLARHAMELLLKDWIGFGRLIAEGMSVPLGAGPSADITHNLTKIFESLRQVCQSLNLRCDLSAVEAAVKMIVNAEERNPMFFRYELDTSGKPSLTEDRVVEVKKIIDAVTDAFACIEADDQTSLASKMMVLHEKAFAIRE